jgi:hypothetical protein
VRKMGRNLLRLGIMEPVILVISSLSVVVALLFGKSGQELVVLYLLTVGVLNVFVLTRWVVNSRRT